MSFNSRWLYAGIFFIVTISLLAAGCGSSGSSGDAAKPVIVRTLSGIVQMPTSSNADLRMSYGQAPVMGAKVWLKGYSDIAPQFTDASGSYTFKGVPADEHFVVSSFEVGNVTHKQRVRASVQNDATDTQVPILSLAEAKTVLTGVLKDASGNFIPAGTEMKLWGEIFTVGANGTFTTPPLPASESSAEIFVKAPGAATFSSFHGPFIAGNTPAFIEQTVLPPTSTNQAPSGSLSARNSAQVNTINCTANELMTLSLIAYDPDSADTGRLAYEWSASQGSLQVLTSKTSANWTAMDNRGVATISVLITDPAGASCKVHLRMLVSIQSMDETDTIAPEVASRTPVDGAISIPIDSNITVKFSEEILESTVATAISATSQGTTIPGTSQLQSDGKTIIWSPTASLPGNRTITVSLSPNIADLYGNKLGTTPTWSFSTVLVPNITITSLYSGDTTPTITGTVDDPECTVQITVDSKTYSATLNGTAWSAQVTDPLSHGTYDVSAAATNKQGITGRDSTTNELVIDTQPKDAVIINPPPELTNQSTFSITIGGTGITAYNYQLNSLAWSDEPDGIPVTTKISLKDLSNGTHELKVVGKDLAGNWQLTASPTRCVWVIDTSAKVAELATATLPLNPTNQTTTNITVITGGGTNVTRYRFQLDSGSWSAITLASYSIKLSGLSNGMHTIRVVGGDDLGNWQPYDATSSHTWEIDATAKVAVLSGTPPNPTIDDFVNITVGGTDVTSYTYSLDDGIWSDEMSAATDTLALSGLSEGSHTLRVVAGDDLGNWQAKTNATTFTWTVDKTPPVATLTANLSGPTRTSPIKVDINFNETVSGFTIDDLTVSANATKANLIPSVANGQAWTVDVIPIPVENASMTITVDLAAGKVVDAASNTNAVSTQLVIAYDSKMPTPTLTPATAVRTNAASVTVTVEFDEIVTVFTASSLTLSGGSVSNLQPETSTGKLWTVSVASTTDGVVKVNMNGGKVFDLAGNGNATAIEKLITFDRTSPSAAISYSPVGPYKQGTSVTITASFNEPMSATTTPKIKISGEDSKGPDDMTRSNETTYTYSYTAPGTVTGECTIELSVGTDIAGNVVNPTPTAGAKFTIDNTRPTNQGFVLTNSQTVKGGANVTIVASDNTTGGSASDTVCLATNSTTIFLPDNITFSPGTTIASGSATIIKAPASAGTYSLFVIDAAGNVSAASTKTVTVDNTAPNADISYSPVVATYSKNTVVTITATFGKDMSSTEPVRIALSGAATLAATAMTRSDATTYTYPYTVTTGEGVVNVALTGKDLAGNDFDSITSGGSFNIDTVAPTTQDSYLSASTTVKGGVGITITSGDAANAVWLAPAGTTSFAECATMTTAAGNASSINAPADEGIYRLFVLDEVRNVSNPSANTVTVDNTSPIVVKVSAESADGSYKAASTIYINIEFDMAVAVGGTPVLTLETGSTDQIASYSSGHNSKILTFYYIVQDGDYSIDLDYSGNNALALNGGSMKSTDGTKDAILTLPAPGAAGSLSANSSIVVDTTPPTVSYVTASGTQIEYNLGQQVEIEVHFTENVFVFASKDPKLSLETGRAEPTQAAFDINKSSGKKLVFIYTVESGDSADPLDYIDGNSLDLNGSYIRDAAQNNATLLLPTPGGPGSLSNKNIIIYAP